MGCNPCKHKVLVHNENYVCYLCLDNYPEYIHSPCGHFGICEKCKNVLNKNNNQYKNKCPICNQKCKLQKIYFQGINNDIINRIETYSLHIQQKENERLLKENKKILQENRRIKGINEMNIKNNNKLKSEICHYKNITNKNAISFENLVNKYNEKMQTCDLKQNVFKIKKYQLLNQQKECYNKIRNRDIYIVQLLKEYNNLEVNIDNIDEYIQKGLNKNVSEVKINT